MIQAVIFDLDGLLADTEPLHCRAFQEALADQGVVVSDREYREHWIREGKGIEDLETKRQITLDRDRVRATKAKRYRELVLAQVRPMPGALQALERLYGQVVLALATSSTHDAARAVLETLGFDGFFSYIATKSDAMRLKPHPDIFLATATKLKVPPNACVVVEDAEKGVVAAHAAGMRSIAIPNDHTWDNNFSKADLLLPSLRELTLETIDEAFRGFGV